ncbi:glycoside hydrolase domain-containing protein [Victivallis vadensis]|uniref:glycoside hydrolase domain-containing protein n=1 Tax=Victivallis vadensis TaxID=172901 RepID=UPI003AF875D4
MIFPRSVSLTAVILSACALGAAEPSASIPPLSAPVTLDGKLSPGEWDDAAVLRRIFKLDNRIPGVPATEFRVKYTPEALYVAAIGTEPDRGLPQSVRRGWDDLLFHTDDAFSVILGQPDANVAVQEAINMGGYEGAMGGRAAPADFYYTYTVNAAGSCQRMFNEMPLEKALFEAAAGRETGKRWTAEFKIPFQSCGLDDPAGKRLYANFFRWRAPEAQAWNHKRFKGYAAMPFGTLLLLPPGREAERTVENRPPRPAPAAKQCRAELQYSPLTGAIVGKAHLTGKWENLTGTLNVTGFPELRRQLAGRTAVNRDAIVQKDGERLAYVIRKLMPGSQPARQAVFTVRDASGKTVAEARLECPAVTAPEWFQTAVAREYVSEKCPAPWTPPTVQGNRVNLAHDSFIFNDFALPCNALVEIAADGRQFRFHGSRTLVSAGNEVRGEARLAAGTLPLEIRSRMEFDGFTEVKFRLPGVDPGRINAVRLRIPVPNEQAKLLLPGQSVQDAAALPPSGYRGPGRQFWLGSYDRGLSFSFDTELFFGRNPRRQIEVIPGKETTELVFNFADGTGQFERDTVFRFFLQPTPTKPRPERPIRDLTERKWEQWSDWHGYPDTGKIPELRRWTDGLKKQDKIGILYTCQGLREDAPYFQEFRSDFELQPRWRYYRHRGRDCYATNKRGPEGELQLYYWKQLIEHGGVRGIASDGTSPAWGDANPALAEVDAPDRRAKWEEMSSRVVAQRNFLKRLRGLFTDTGEPFALLAHTGGGLDVNTLSFFDGYMEGEQMTRFKTGYFLPEAVYATGYSGLPWGWRSVFWSKHWRNYLAQESSLAYSLLYNTEFNGNFQAENPNYDLELTRDFERGKGEFHPFWKPDKRVAFRSERAKMSFHTAPGKALIAVSNLTTEPAEYALDFSKLFPDGEFHAVELLSNRPVTSAAVTGKLAPHSCDVIRVDAGKIPAASVPLPPPPSPAFAIETPNPADWEANLNRKTVSFHAGENGFRLESRPGSHAAVATFLHSFDRDLEMDLQVKLPGRFRFTLGPVTVGYGNGWVGYGWFVQGPVAKRGTGHVYYQVPPVKDRFAPLRISLRDGELNVVYNHMPVVRDLKLDLPAGNQFTLQTWHDDKLEFRLVRAASRGENIIQSNHIHPVLK